MAEGHETEPLPSDAPVVVVGSGTDKDHDVPFQMAAAIAGNRYSLSAIAMQNLGEKQETEVIWAMVPELLATTEGVSTCVDHEVPFQKEALPTLSPAMQKWVEGHESETNEPLVTPEPIATAGDHFPGDGETGEATALEDGGAEAAVLEEPPELVPQALSSSTRDSRSPTRAAIGCW